jgi:hypothetical protein
MTDRRTLSLEDAWSAYAIWCETWRWVKATLKAGNRLTVEIRKTTRSTEQNALMWSVLTDLSRQVLWPVDGVMQPLEPDEWKDVLSAGVTKAQRVAQGIEGGWVMLGQRTSKMTIAEMSALITFAHAFGDQRGVRWSRTSLGRDVPEEAFA